MTDITRRALTHPATSSAIGVLALFVLLTGIVGVSTVPASAQTSGLVAAYGFSEGAGPTVADGSGNNNTGTLGSGVTWTAAGRYGSALVFNGAGFVTVPNAAALQLTTAMTLSAWVNPTTVSSAWRDVIYKGNDNYYLSGTSTNASRPAGGGTFGGTTIETYGTAALAVNTWTHLAVTYDGATVRLYVNGAQVSSLARTGALTTSTNALQIGGDSIWGQYFQGMIDEVRVYNRALSAAEIGTDMSTAVGGGGNTAPTITPIANQTINEDTATGALSFTVGDAETAPGSLTVSGSSSNLGLVPNGNIVFGGSGANRTVTVTPAANQNGTATITVTVSDGQLSTPTSFLLTVTAVNDPPTITSIANQTTTAGTAVGPLSFTVGDVETPAGSLTVSGSSSNLTLVPTGNIVFGGTGANRTVTVTPAAGQTGTATITVAVSDGQLSTPTSFQLTVTATNTAPTITPIADQTINEDTATGALAFTVGDAETAPGSLTVSGSSSNPTLVPNGNIVFGGTGANRTVTVTPAANQNGTATITVTVSDGQLSTPTSFQLTVTAVNDAPTITSIANQTTTVGTAVGPLSFTVGDVETAAGSLTVSGSSSNPGLVPNANIVFGGSGANRTVTVTPAAGQTGTATITVAVSDGQLSTPTSFQLTVTATPAGLVAAYGFSEGAGPTVADGSGNNNTGTLGSGVTWTAAGRYGSALVFNGAGYVTVPNATSLQLTNGMTLSAWIYPTAVPTNWATTVMKEQPNEFVYVLYAGSPANRPNVYINQGPGTSTEHGFAGPSALPLSAWSHLASTYDGTTLRLYVNGVQVGSQAVGGPIATSTGALRIGGNGVWNEYFQGRIDELRVYNRALSAAEITTDMNSAVGGGGGGDTTPPAVAVTSPAGGSTVFNFVSVAATASDNVAVAGVSFFVDGSPIAAEVTSAPYSVVWDSTTSSPGSHTVTAVARDFAGNTTTSAPVSVTVVATSPSNIGQFGPVTAWPFVAVNAVLLRTGEVLAWDGQTFGGKDARIWNPSTNVFTPVPISQTNLFCTGQCALADGRILVAGGHVDAAHVGVTDTNIFDPAARTWTKVASMTYPRWYPTTTTLPDGRVLVVAGEMNCDKCDALIPEIYNPQTNTWIQLTSASLLFPYYPHMFVLPNGRVLVASTAEDPIVSRVLDLQSQTWTVVDPAAVDGGSAVMYLPGKVLKAGTSTDPDMPTVPSAATAYIIDMTQPSPLWQAITPMTFQRTYGTLTLLPDGSALMVGGGVTTNAIDASGAIAPLELWSPLTQKWTTMAGLGAPRLYHSTALLLPDGRVLIAGGGRFFGSPDQTDQLSAEIYSPPYLFKGARPTITSAPTTATYGGTFTVQTPDAARVTAINLVKLGAVTHAFNMDQRFLPLSFSPVSGGFTVQAPANGNLAPPGYYMLFLIDTNGVPSVAAMLKLQ